MIYESIQKERVSVGDVIYIESNSGAVKVRESTQYHTNEYITTLLTHLNPSLTRLVMVRGSVEVTRMPLNSI